MLIWAGCRSLGLGQNVPWHSWAKVEVPSTMTAAQWVVALPTNWNTSQMSSLQPESQKHKLIPSMLWRLSFPIHLDTCLCVWVAACSELAWLNYSLRHNHSVQNFSPCRGFKSEQSHNWTSGLFSCVKDGEGRNAFMCPSFIIYMSWLKLASWQSAELSEGSMWSKTHVLPKQEQLWNNVYCLFPPP